MEGNRVWRSLRGVLPAGGAVTRPLGPNGGDPWEQNHFLQPHLPGVVSESLVPAGDPRASGEGHTKGKPWEEAIQAQPRGVAFPLQVLTPFGILSPLFSLLLLGKASHLPGTSMSSAEPVQQGSYDNCLGPDAGFPACAF